MKTYSTRKRRVKDWILVSCCEGLSLDFDAPIGPIGVLCIRRAIAEGRISGLASGFGAATADAIYGCITGLGLTFISDFLIS